jgi:hypothetical protein
MSWCANCGVPINDGLLLCKDCVSRGDLKQSVHIELTSAPNVKFDSEGNVLENTPGSGKSTVKAYDMSAGSVARSPLRAVQKVQWNHDRKQNERAVFLFDRNNNLYCETWFDLTTGQITWGPKRGPLDDQSMHGPAGSKP